MKQPTSDRDLQDLKAAIDKGFENLDNKLDDLKSEVRADIKELRSDIKALDNRLWGFGATILITVLAALLTIFGRFLFSGNP